MKLLSFKQKDTENTYRIGTMLDDQIVDLQLAYELMLKNTGEEVTESIEDTFPADPTAFFAAGKKTIAKAKQTYKYLQANSNKEQFYYNRSNVSLGIPIPRPEKIICVGRNYAEHATEMNNDVPDYPVLFAKYITALIGPEDAIEKSPATNMLDYEAELVVVIGKEATKVKQKDAYNYIAGYTIGNDITARDLQKRTPQWLQGKTIDNSTPLGPWVVTADEIDDPSNLKIRSYVNGEKRQDSSTDKFIFDIPFLIEFISNLITLKPGDVILTGTPDGVGVAMDPPNFLVEGDIVRSEVSGIGSLENKVIKSN